MALFSLLIGLAACIVLIPSLLPFLGFINYVNIPIARIGFLMGRSAKNKTALTGDTNYVAWLGIILNIIAIIIGLFRLLIKYIASSL